MLIFQVYVGFLALLLPITFSAAVAAVATPQLRKAFPSRRLTLEQLDRWDQETVPVTVDLEQARAVDMWNALEGWDHW